MKCTSRGHQAGFTLIELLLVIGIVGILSAIAVPQLLQSRLKAKTATCDRILHALDGELVLEAQRLEESGTPSNTVANLAILNVVSRHKEPNPYQSSRAVPCVMTASSNASDNCAYRRSNSVGANCQITMRPVGSLPPVAIEGTQRLPNGPVRTYQINWSR